MLLRTIVVLWCFEAVALSLAPLTRSHEYRQGRSHGGNFCAGIVRDQPVSSDDAGENSMNGYKFGDISRSLAKRVAGRVNHLTGKDAYELGDLSRWIDGRAKERVQAIKGQIAGDYKYEFGDLARWADAVAKDRAAHFTGKTSAQDHQLGDISVTVIRKVRSGEYNLEDVYLALRVLATAGFAVLPIARLLPVQALIQLVNLGLAKDIGGRLMGILATTLDARMKDALTGNANYQLGDMTKDRLRHELARFTGKSTYDFGDIAHSIANRGLSGRSASQVMGNDDDANELTMLDQLSVDLAAWDAKFLEHDSRNATGALETLFSPKTQE